MQLIWYEIKPRAIIEFLFHLYSQYMTPLLAETNKKNKSQKN